MNVLDMTAEMCASALLRPDADANKYTRGRLVCVGGSAEFPGAIAMASRAGFLVGAGYVEVFGSQAAADICHLRYPSIVARDWSTFASSAGGRAGESFSAVATLDANDCARPRAVLAGSGCRGRDIIEQRLFLDVIENAVCPVVLDGGALSFLAGRQGFDAIVARAEAGYKSILTPHMGEALRLSSEVGIDFSPSGASASELVDFAEALSKSYRAVVCLKGPVTYICDSSSGCAFVMKDGTPALAKAGTGDVLAGVIAGFAAQGVECIQAACSGSYLHAIAGRCASEVVGEISVCAEDVLEALPGAIMKVSEGDGA